MKIWIDAVRPAPEGNWVWIKSVNAAKRYISMTSPYGVADIMLSVDPNTDDYIELINWLKETDRNYPIHIHSQNSEGVANMRAIIERNDWKEVI